MTVAAVSAVHLEHVSFAYDSGAPVLHDVDLRIGGHETVALVGRSGVGKSSLLKLVNGLLTPASGRVLVDGRDVRHWDSVALRRHSGYVLQDVGLFPHLNVADNITLVARLAKQSASEIAQRLESLLSLVGLPADLASRWPDELSGGQRQRVGVARALALDPPILLMDEPFGALDPLTRLDLHREFTRIQRDLRKAIVLVTHDLREARLLADRIGVLEEGRLVALGPFDDLRESDHPFVARLLDTLEDAT